jgi:hypothetical protein
MYIKAGIHKLVSFHSLRHSLNPNRKIETSKGLVFGAGGIGRLIQAGNTGAIVMIINKLLTLKNTVQ